MLHEPVYLKEMGIDGIEASGISVYRGFWGEYSGDFVIIFIRSKVETHITGFKTKFTTIMNQYARERSGY